LLYVKEFFRQIHCAPLHINIIHKRRDISILPAGDRFDLDPTNSSGLSLRVRGGVRLDGGYKSCPNVTLTLTDDAVNYIEVSDAGVISTNTSSFTPGRSPLYEVTTVSSVVTACKDWRGNPTLGEAGSAIMVRAEAAALAAGDLVYVSGWSETYGLPLVTKADANALMREAAPKAPLGLYEGLKAIRGGYLESPTTEKKKFAVSPYEAGIKAAGFQSTKESQHYELVGDIGSTSKQVAAAKQRIYDNVIDGNFEAAAAEAQKYGIGSMDFARRLESTQTEELLRAMQSLPKSKKYEYLDKALGLQLIGGIR